MLSEDIKQYTFINTFTRKPQLAQIVVYLISLFEPLTAYLIIQQRLQNYQYRLSFIIVYSALLVGKVASTIIVSVIDPSDKLMVLAKQNSDGRNNQQIANMKQKQLDYLFCRQCICFVKNKSKHCKKCKRCVQRFDHHCIWLNNCIGQLNYKPFIFLLIFVQLEMSFYLVGGALLWSEHKFHCQQSYCYPLFEIILVWIMMFFVSIFWLLNLTLISLHIFLISSQLTTYQWLFPSTRILNFNKKKQSKDNSKQRVEDDFQIQGNVQFNRDRDSSGTESQQNFHHSKNIQIRKHRSTSSESQQMRKSKGIKKIEFTQEQIKDTVDFGGFGFRKNRIFPMTQLARQSEKKQDEEGQEKSEKSQSQKQQKIQCNRKSKQDSGKITKKVDIEDIQQAQKRQGSNNNASLGGNSVKLKVFSDIDETKQNIDLQNKKEKKLEKNHKGFQSMSYVNKEYNRYTEDKQLRDGKQLPNFKQMYQKSRKNIKTFNSKTKSLGNLLLRIADISQIQQPTIVKELHLQQSKQQNQQNAE